jgi:hypothetical protein
MKPHPPMTGIVDTAASRPTRPEGHLADLHLLRDCQALASQQLRLPARVRLEEAVGEEFARKLLRSLVVGERRP